MKIVLYISILTMILFSSCSDSHRPNQLAYYYWKTNFQIDSTDYAHLKDNHCGHLYLRMFDVSWDREKNIPMPQAALQFTNQIDTSLSYIPVVYITQECLKKLSLDSCRIIGNLLALKSDKICEFFHIPFTQFQLDADWSETTKEKYFMMITSARNYFQNKKTISCTIRLHQIKYPEKTGIPPVDRGMLMYYNMGDLNDKNESNSIFNLTTANQYNSSIKQYKLPLDIALPYFSWGVLYRGNKAVHLLNGLDEQDIQTKLFTKEKQNWYRVNDFYTWQGIELYAGDKIKLEGADEKIFKQAWESVMNHHQTDSFTVAIFDYKPKTDVKKTENITDIINPRH